MTHRHSAFSRLGVLLGAGLLTFAPVAHASLGRAYSSVETDRSRLGAKLASTASSTYNVHTLTLANTGVVREYARPDGTVFAVVWRAPGRPDLRQLLGDNFDILQADNAITTGRRTHRPISVHRSNLVIETGGHPGAFWGAALMPRLQPAGFSASDLQ